MNIEYLYYFKEISTQMNITRAANKIGLTQSSLSKILSKMEDEIGYQLFNRSAKSIYLNSYGERFLNYCLEVIEATERITQDLQIMEKQQHEQLRIGSTNYLFLYGWLSHYLQENRQTILLHEVMTLDELKRKLSSGLIDMAITSVPIIAKGISCDHIARDQLVLLIHETHPLLTKSACLLNREEIINQRYVALPQTFEGSRFIDVISKVYHFLPKIIFEGETEMLYDFLPRLHAVEVYLDSLPINDDRYHKRYFDSSEVSINIYVSYKSFQSKVKIKEISSYISRHFNAFGNNEDNKT